MEWKSIYSLISVNLNLYRDIIDILDDKYDELLNILVNTKFRDRSETVKYHCDSILKLINNFASNILNIN